MFVSPCSPYAPTTPLPSPARTGTTLSGVQWTARNDSPELQGNARAIETGVST